MRIYVVPIYRKYWCFYCSPSNVSKSKITQWASWGSTKWDKFGEAPDGTWKNKLYTAGNRLLDRTEYDEWFLKGVPSFEERNNVDEVPVLYPSTMDAKEVESRLISLISERTPYHQKYYRLSLAWIPLSLSFGIVPLVPNIPFAYNAFRLYSHYKAFLGAKHLDHLQDISKFKFEANEVLEEYYLDAEKMENHVVEKKMIINLAQKLNLSGLEHDALRARQQVVSKLKKAAIESGESTDEVKPKLDTTQKNIKP